MNYLLQGGESQERLDLLLSLTKISSEPIIGAITDYLVKGFSESESVAFNGATQSNFNRSMTVLNKTAETVEKIKEIDWSKFNESLK